MSLHGYEHLNKCEAPLWSSRMMKQDDVRYRWYKSDDARFWIVDEVLGHNLGFCRSESVAERLCEKLNLLEMEIVWN